MAAVDKTLELIDKAQKIRRLHRWGTLFVSSGGGIALIVLAVVFILLLILIALIPFIIFGEKEAMTSSASQWNWMEPKYIDTDGMAYAWPVPTISRITSYFGLRNVAVGSKNHKGIDIANGAANTELVPIYAMAAGTVSAAGPASGYGQVVILDHEGELQSVYGHLDYRMEVRVGDYVEKGQRIGRIGAGKVGTSSGPHLHFEVRLSGTKVDPLQYVKPPSAEMNVPIELSYRSLNTQAVLAYLKEKKSALADTSILAMIDQAGKAQNIDPHFLIAITGQEQSFVPASHRNADLIIKNPWNVFGCWCKGKGATLTTQEAAEIAAKTIVKLSQSRPSDVDPIFWLVSRDNPHGYYAEHQGWWIGVKKFYKQLLEAEG